MVCTVAGACDPCYKGKHKLEDCCPGLPGHKGMVSEAINTKWDGRVAHLVECLPSHSQSPGSNLQYYHKQKEDQENSHK
jgi:hypothetical protein